MISHDTALDMLHIASLAYDYKDNNSKDDEEFSQILIQYPKGRVIQFISDELSDVQVGITINDDKQRICVVFRGSNSMIDWYYNLQSTQFTIKDNIRVHHGFCKQLFATNLYHRIVYQVQAQLRSFPQYDLFVTGHSAGGALSTLFGYLLSGDMPRQKINIVSFASPRIGNYDFKCDFESRSNIVHSRVTNMNDIITATPVINYYHVGTKIYIRSKQCWCCCLNICDHKSNVYRLNLLDTRW